MVQKGLQAARKRTYNEVDVRRLQDVNHLELIESRARSWGETKFCRCFHETFFGLDIGILFIICECVPAEHLMVSSLTWLLMVMKKECTYQAFLCVGFVQAELSLSENGAAFTAMAAVITSACTFMTAKPSGDHYGLS